MVQLGSILQNNCFSYFLVLLRLLTASWVVTGFKKKKKNSKNQEIQENHVLSPFPAKSIRIPYVVAGAGGWLGCQDWGCLQPAPAKKHKESLCFWLEMATVHDFPDFLDFCCFFFFLKPVTTQLAAWWKATPVLPAHSLFFPPGSSFEILLLTLP